MNQDSLVTTYTQGSGVDKTGAGTGSQQDFLDENGQGKQHFLLQFHKTVIGHLAWKQVFQMFTDIFLVVMLEAAEATGVEQDKNNHNLASLMRLGLLRRFCFLSSTINFFCCKVNSLQKSSAIQ